MQSCDPENVGPSIFLSRYPAALFSLLSLPVLPFIALPTCACLLVVKTLLPLYMVTALCYLLYGQIDPATVESWSEPQKPLAILSWAKPVSAYVSHLRFFSSTQVLHLYDWEGQAVIFCFSQMLGAQAPQSVRRTPELAAAASLRGGR